MTTQEIWKKYRSIPAYQHILYLSNKCGILKVTKKDFEAMDYWDDTLDKIADKVKKEQPKDTFNWNKEFPEEYIASLRVWITKLEKEFKLYYTSTEVNRAKGLDFFTRQILAWGHGDIGQIEKKLKKLRFDLYLAENKEELVKNEISPEMIVRAREFPFTSLMEINSRQFGICPFHKERTPSFYVKNNFGFCFGCQKSCDTIGYIMQTRNKSFVESVQSLQ